MRSKQAAAILFERGICLIVTRYIAARGDAVTSDGVVDKYEVITAGYKKEGDIESSPTERMPVSRSQN